MHQPVDRTRAADQLAVWQRVLLVVQARLGVRRVVPPHVVLVEDDLGEAQRDPRPKAPVFGAGLEQQDLRGGVLGEPSGHDRPG